MIQNKPVSAFLQNKITTLLPQIDVNKFVSVGNIVDSETFIYRDKVTQQQQIHFCAIATWAYKKTPDKLPELFIEALSAFQKKSNKSIVLTMIGGGDRLNDLKELCSNFMILDIEGQLHKNLLPLVVLLI